MINPSKKICFPLFLLFISDLSGQTTKNRNNIDSSFTLAKQVRNAKSGMGEHGVFFNETPKQVLKDFQFFAVLGATNLANYHQQVIVDHHHIIKIWTSQKANAALPTIIEINSTYIIDTTEENSEKFKAAVFYTDYFIRLRDSTKNA
jgi:hypothetical protein